MRWIRTVNYDQAALIPDDMRRWLPEGHVSWRMLEVTGEMDLSAFYAAYRQDGQGQAPYDPKMMLALVCYCLYKGIRSSRKIAAACTDDVGARLICGGPGPSHKTVAEFRKRHRAAITGLFTQVLGIMAAEGAIEGRSCAVDGSPASGNASRFGNMTAGQLESRIAALEEKLAAATAEWLDGTGAQPALDDGDGDDDDDGPPAGMPRRISLMTAKLARLHTARERLAARAAAPGGAGARAAAAREKAERLQAELDKAEAAQDALVAGHEAALAAGRKGHSGTAPVPKEKNARICLQRKRARSAWERARAAAGKAAVLIAGKLKVNPADPDTRLLPAKNGGGWLQGWNLQLGAARRQVLLAVELHDSPADAEALVPVIRAAMANIAEAARRPGAAGLRDQVRAWLADNGYASAASFAELEDLLLLVAVTSEGAQAGRRDGGRGTPEAWKPMQARLATPAGKALYKRRAACVEPAFAQYFARFGRCFHYRGRVAVDAEARLLGTVHNLAKLFAHRDRAERKARQAARTRAAPAPA
jgi:transposase